MASNAHHNRHEGDRPHRVVYMACNDRSPMRVDSGGLDQDRAKKRRREVPVLRDQALPTTSNEDRTRRAKRQVRSNALGSESQESLKYQEVSRRSRERRGLSIDREAHRNPESPSARSIRIPRGQQASGLQLRNRSSREDPKHQHHFCDEQQHRHYNPRSDTGGTMLHLEQPRAARSSILKSKEPKEDVRSKALSLNPQPPRPVEGPSAPLHLPTTLQQLKILLLVGFLSDTTLPPALCPALPRFILECPIHSLAITRAIKSFYRLYRGASTASLFSIRSSAVASQLLELSQNLETPQGGPQEKLLTVEPLTDGEVIVNTFDFGRCDAVVRASLRPMHPSQGRFLWTGFQPGGTQASQSPMLDSSVAHARVNMQQSLPPLSYHESFAPGVEEGGPYRVIPQMGPFINPNLVLSTPSTGGGYRSMIPPSFAGMASLHHPPPHTGPNQRVGNTAGGSGLPPQQMMRGRGLIPSSNESFENQNDIEELLNAPSTKVGLQSGILTCNMKEPESCCIEQQVIDSGAELRDLLCAPTAKHSITTRTFQSRGGSKVQHICRHGTRHDCFLAATAEFNKKRDFQHQGQFQPHVCSLIHFRRILLPHTDLSLGDCSYLDTCRHMATCRFVHYEVDLDTGTHEQRSELLERSVSTDPVLAHTIGTIISSQVEELPAQWMNCDVRKFDWSIFRGKMKIVMADPPWDIHMDLPYGTMTDIEMKSLRLDLVQDEGCLFLWVTGRAMELGRECMKLWGYRQIEEIVWVKTNQLHRIIRTGRTGHWLNHSKEHCLVGIKGQPKLNRNIDTDTIVAEVRETSRKPDEIYRIIERLSPGPYKLELFGRPHNVRNNWLTLGNQLDGIRLHDPQIIQRYNAFAAEVGDPLYLGAGDSK